MGIHKSNFKHMLGSELTVTTQRKDLKVITEKRLEMSCLCSAEIRKAMRMVVGGIQTKTENSMRSP